MGLFKKREPEQTQNPNAVYYAPQGATTEWFRSDFGKNLFNKIQREKVGDIWYFKRYWYSFIDSLPNIKAIKATCANTDKNIDALQLLLSKILALLSIQTEKDMFGDTVLCDTASYDYLMDANKSAFVDYAEKVKFGMTDKVTKVVCSIMLNNAIDTEEAWLYDESIFGLNSEKEVLQKLGEIIKERGFSVDLNSPILSYN